ncbi:MAG: sigma-70 family RNA polymerase sigma factor [Phycisphaerae bacterium]
MSETAADQVTRILADVRRGDMSGAQRLLPLVYDELHALAEEMFRRQPPGHTWQPTALVHEVYLRLVNPQQTEWRGRAHFLAVAAKAMRRLLIDHARKRKTQKRGAEWECVTLDGVVDAAADRAIDVVALHEALGRLAGLHERQARVVELRTFGGLTIPEAAEVLGIGATTVDNDWSVARAWLIRELGADDDR